MQARNDALNFFAGHGTQDGQAPAGGRCAAEQHDCAGCQLGVKVVQFRTAGKAQRLQVAARLREALNVVTMHHKALAGAGLNYVELIIAQHAAGDAAIKCSSRIFTQQANQFHIDSFDGGARGSRDGAAGAKELVMRNRKIRRRIGAGPAGCGAQIQAHG